MQQLSALHGFSASEEELSLRWSRLAQPHPARSHAYAVTQQVASLVGLLAHTRAHFTPIHLRKPCQPFVPPCHRRFHLTIEKGGSRQPMVKYQTRHPLSSVRNPTASSGGMRLWLGQCSSPTLLFLGGGLRCKGLPIRPMPFPLNWSTLCRKLI